MLHAAGVDEAHPDPRAAWEVFKRYVAVPVECARDYLFFQVGEGRPEHGLDGYFDFTREFEMRGPWRRMNWGTNLARSDLAGPTLLPIGSEQPSNSSTWRASCQSFSQERFGPLTLPGQTH
jgi:hypothetical protein